MSSISPSNWPMSLNWSFEYQQSQGAISAMEVILQLRLLLATGDLATPTSRKLYSR